MNGIEYAQWCATHSIGFYMSGYKQFNTKKLEQLYEDLIPHVALERLIGNGINARLASRIIQNILKDRNHAPESTRSPASSR